MVVDGECLPQLYKLLLSFILAKFVGQFSHTVNQLLAADELSDFSQ